MTEQTNAANDNNVNRNPQNHPERNMHLNETFEDYCLRRQAMNKATKALKYGKEFWDAGYAGTYRNDAKRALQAERKAQREAKRNG